MDICCIVIIILLCCYWAYKANEESEAQRAEEKREMEYKLRKEEEERKRQKEERERWITEHNQQLAQYKDKFNSKLSYVDIMIYNYDGVCSSLSEIIDSIKKETYLFMQRNVQVDESLVPQLTLKVNQLRNFGKKVQTTSYKTMFIPAEYGKINQPYWDEVRGVSCEGADSIIDTYDSWIKNMETEKFEELNPELIVACAWAYAISKPFVAPKFQKARHLFDIIYQNKFADLEIAEYYAIKQMGGEGVLREHVREMIRENRYSASEDYTMIASGLMWMNAYQEENMVLQHMLSNGLPMDLKTQERLHSLSNGGGKAPSGFNVVSSVDKLYFDVSSLAWRDEEYTGMFENLSFQDKTLDYSLAIRDEDKYLVINQGIKVPDMKTILKKLNDVLDEEYGDIVKGELRHCIALSGSGEEEIEAIVAKSKECLQMGILVHIARIGKKLNIKFYTLFMPEGTELMKQKQQALSLFKKLSPSVTMWESSLKDTILMAMQQILNTATQGDLLATSKGKESDDDLEF